MAGWRTLAILILVGTRHLIPHAERTGSQRPVVNRSEQVTADTEEVLHESVHREKPLRVRGGFESTHLPLALARRLMRDFRSIVLVLPGAVNDGRHDRAVGGRIAAQLVRDQTVGRPALSFQDRAKEVPEGPPDDLRVLFVGLYYRGQRRLDLEREYLDVYRPTNEAIPRLRQLPAGHLVPIKDLYTAEELNTSRTYNEALLRGSGSV